MVRALGTFFGNSASQMSSEVNRPDRRMTMLSSSSSHSRINPGPTPSFRRMLAGTDLTLTRKLGMRNRHALHITRVRSIERGYAANI